MLMQIPVSCNNDHVVLLIYSFKYNQQDATLIIFFKSALHVSGGFSVHHQELKNCTHSIGYVPGLLAATASVGELELQKVRLHADLLESTNLSDKLTVFPCYFSITTERQMYLWL